MPFDKTEFALAETHEPHLFVVRKQQRQQQQAGTVAPQLQERCTQQESSTPRSDCC